MREPVEPSPPLRSEPLQCLAGTLRSRGQRKPALREEASRIRDHRFARTEARSRELAAALEGRAQTTAQVGERRLESTPLGHHALGGRGGRRRALVRDQVRERPVDLVSDRRDDGDPRSRDRANHDLVVEAPEVLGGAAATPHDDHLDDAMAVQLVDGRRDVLRRPVALHAAGSDDDAAVRVAPLEGLQDVAEGCPVKRRRDADRTRQERERTLAIGREEALGSEPRLQVLERAGERPDPVGLEPIHLDSQATLWRVEVDAADPCEDVHPLGGPEAERADGVAPHHDLDLSPLFLEGSERVAAGDHPKRPELTLDPERLRECDFETVANPGDQPPDGEGTRGSSRRRDRSRHGRDFTRSWRPVS